MKIWVPLFVAVCSSLTAYPRHHVVLLGGRTHVGTVLTLTGDAITFQPGGKEPSSEIALDTILYVHNGAGKLFFISPRLEKFLERARGRGGRLETVDGLAITYQSLKPELYMYGPRVIVDKREAFPLESIHRIVVDRSLSEYAVRKGFIVGMGISLIRFLAKFESIRQWTKAPGYAIEVYPGTVTFTPLVTFGWVVYDFFYGDRELVIN